MKGTATDTVASSWIDALGGVSMCWIFSTPPAFWLQPLPGISSSAAVAAAVVKRQTRAIISSPPRSAALIVAASSIEESMKPCLNFTNSAERHGTGAAYQWPLGVHIAHRPSAADSFILLSPASGERLGEGEAKDAEITQACDCGRPLT